MKELLSKIDGTKTYITVTAGLLTIIGAYLSGDLTIAEAVTQGLTLLGIAAVRHGVSKNGNPN